MAIVLLSYADGPEVYQSNQRALVRSAREQGIELVKAFSRADLREAFRTEHDSILRAEEGAGYWLWKPRIILDALEAAPENQIVVYVDVGATLRQPLDVLVEQARLHEGVFFWNDYPNWMHVKRDCFALTATNTPQYHQARQVDAALIVLRNTERVRSFVREWLAACTDPRILTDLPNTCGEENLPGFRGHRHDQSVLTVLLLRERAKLDFKFYARRVKHRFICHHRRRTRWMPIWAWEATHDGAGRYWSTLRRRWRTGRTRLARLVSGSFRK